MSDLTDTARMDEAKRMMASQANTSVFLMDAELTARNRYETETDIEEQTAAFVDGVAWCAQHLHDHGGHVCGPSDHRHDSKENHMNGNDKKGRAERLYAQARDALNRHEDPFSRPWAESMRMSQDDMSLLMDMMSARLAYADRLVHDGKEPR